MSSSSSRLRALLHRVFPIAQWLPSYSRTDARGDLAAGLTVGVMLIPMSMAYALLAGVPPIYGLYASLVPLLVYPLFATSRHLAVGVIAIDMLIISAGVSVLAEPLSDRYIALVILLALMTGAIQVVMGTARLGFLVNLLSRPVIAGFTSAAALIIAASQLGPLLGLELPRTQSLLTLGQSAIDQARAIAPLTAALSGGALALLLGLRAWKPSFPAPLVAFVLGTLLVWGFDLDARGIAVVSTIPTGLPTPAVPSVALADLGALWQTALTLALVQFMTVMSLGKVFAARHRYTIRPNRELFAIGAANLAGSLFRGLPISGSFSRTAVNADAGARTALANVVAAGLVALTLLVLTPIFAYLPIPVLAAIIVVAALGLFDATEVRLLFRIKRRDGAIALLTFLSTLVFGIQEGILVGIGASVVGVMYRISRPNVAELGHLPGTRSFRETDLFAAAEELEGILILRVDASFSFANADYLRDLILDRSNRTDPQILAVVIDASGINDLDTTAAEVLVFVARTLKERGVELHVSGVKPPVERVMQETGLFDVLDASQLHLSPHRAVYQILKSWGTTSAYLATVPAESAPDEPDGSLAR